MITKISYKLDVSYFSGLNPREDCNIGTLLFPEQSKLHYLNESDIKDPSEIIDNPAILWFPVYMYDHSGIALAITPFKCTYDSSLIGFIYVHKLDLLPSIGPDKVELHLKREIQMLSQYLNGDVYQYIVNKITTVTQDGVEYSREDEYDSCCGYYEISDIIAEVEGLHITEFCGDLATEANDEYSKPQSYLN